MRAKLIGNPVLVSADKADTENYSAEGCPLVLRYAEGLEIGINQNGKFMLLLPEGGMGQAMYQDEDLGKLERMMETWAVEEKIITAHGNVIDKLTAEYDNWLKKNKLEDCAADEILRSNQFSSTPFLNPTQIEYLENFVERWDNAIADVRVVVVVGEEENVVQVYSNINIDADVLDRRANSCLGLQDEDKEAVENIEREVMFLKQII